MDFNGQVALVTGASAGIGREIARQLAAAGACVVVSARRAERLEALVAELGAEPSAESGMEPGAERVRAAPADLAEPGAATRLVEEALAVEGRLDVLVNNAGYGRLVPVDEQTPEAVARQMQVNFHAVVEAMLAAIPAMRAQGGGAILNVGSVVGHFGLPGMGAYVASKFALQGWSEAAGYDLHRHGITVTTLCPGSTRTEFHEHASFQRFRTPHRRRRRMPRLLRGGSASAASVARAGLRGMVRGRTVVIPKLRNRLFIRIHHHVPWFFHRIMRRQAACIDRP